VFENALSEKAQAILSRLSAYLTEWGFYLAGGSGLALQIGHRLSEDLDFFRQDPFDVQHLSRLLEDQGGSLRYILQEQHTLIVQYENVLLSFFQYSVPLIFPPVTILGIPVADWRDIVAEKFKTLSQRGSKKDFYDLYEIFAFEHLIIQEGVDCFKRRFQNTGINFYHVLRSLTYFEDAEGDPEPRLLMHHYQWKEVKGFFKDHIQEFEHCLIES
jgi:hypothetical protein